VLPASQRDLDSELSRLHRLAVEIALARCDQVIAAVTTARTADRSMGRPDVTDVPPGAPPLAA
jgi:hypothetical protein